MKVQEAMHKGVEWRAPETPLVDIAKTMKEHDVGIVPIGKDDKLVGMVTDRDIVCRALVEDGDLTRRTAGDVMTKKVVYCYEDETVEDAIHVMEDNAIRRLPVINRDKRLVGMLSLGDLSHRVPRELSGELVGRVSAHH